tara:strand:- start:467 stop:664 length:198 start_codon:yes stop_codon:yes gene_type:complete
MTDEDIELIVSILSETTDKFWVVYESDQKFMMFGGSPWELKDQLDGKVNPFSWRDRFSKPHWDEI